MCDVDDLVVEELAPATALRRQIIRVSPLLPSHRETSAEILAELTMYRGGKPPKLP